MRRVMAHVKKLRRDIDPKTTGVWARSGGARVEVDYFALLDLIAWFEETQEEINNVLIARDILKNVHRMRGSVPRDKTRIMEQAAVLEQAAADDARPSGGVG